jgi:hypothetical protein
VSKLQHEVAALKKQPKPPAAAETPEKLTSRRTSARCSTTAAGSSSTPRGVSEDGGKRGLQYFRRDFGTAHYKSLSKQIKKSQRTTASGGWDKVYDIAKRKFFAVSMLLPQRTRSRVV